MITTAIILLAIGIVLLAVALQNGLALLKPGVYPPKKVLKNRTVMFGCAGGIILVIGIVILYFI